MMDVLSCQLIDRFERMKSGMTTCQVLEPNFLSSACYLDIEVEAKIFSDEFADNVSPLVPSQMLSIKT